MSWVSWLEISRWKKMLDLCSSFRYICLFGRCACVGAPWCVSAWSKNTFLLLKKIRSWKVSVENSFFSGARARVGKIFSSAKPICVIDRSEFNCCRESSVAEADDETEVANLEVQEEVRSISISSFWRKKSWIIQVEGRRIAPQTRAINDVRASKWERHPSAKKGKNRYWAPMRLVFV